MVKTFIFCAMLLPLLSSCSEVELLRVGILNKPLSLQSWKIRDGVSTVIGNQIHRGLIRTDPSSGATIPSIAKSWEISPKEGNVSFLLDETAKFSDNTPLNCLDAKRSFDRIISLKEETSFKFPEGTKVTCDGTNRLILTLTPIPAMLFDVLASPAAAISKDDGITGAGPYRVIHQDETEILLERVQGKGPKKISFQIADHKTLISRFKDKKIDDLIYLGLFLDVNEPECQVLEGLSPTVFWFGLNSRVPIFKTEFNRKIIQSLIDTGVEVTEIFSKENRVKGLMPYGMTIGRTVASTDALAQRLVELRNKAIALTRYDGKINFYLREIQHDAFEWDLLFNKIDPDKLIFNFRFLNNSDFFKAYYEKKVPAFFVGANITRNDPFEVLSYFRKNDFVNLSGINSDEIDKLMTRSYQAETYEEIRTYAKQSSDWVIQKGYAIPLYSKRFRGCTSNKLKGYHLSPLGPLTIDYSLIERK